MEIISEYKLYIYSKTFFWKELGGSENEIQTRGAPLMIGDFSPWWINKKNSNGSTTVWGAMGFESIDSDINKYSEVWWSNESFN